jgi:hypothetical protein
MLHGPRERFFKAEKAVEVFSLHKLAMAHPRLFGMTTGYRMAKD